MTLDELRLREATIKDTHLQIRCSPDEKRDWLAHAGGRRKLSEWARRILNRACLDPQAPLVESPPGEEPESGDSSAGETRVVYDSPDGH